LEPHAGSHRHPRAIGYTGRTMELFRGAGIAQQIPEAPRNFRLRRCKVESLAGRWFDATDWTPQTAEPARGKVTEAVADECSPHTGAAIAQDRLEPILRERATALGVDLRLGSELVRFEQDQDGVTAWVRERTSRREYSVRAAYMIAADGSKSSVRQALGIGRTGPGHLRTLRSVLFRAPLEPYLEKGISQFEVDQADFKAFLTTYGDGRWVLMFMDDVERDETTLRAGIERAIGRHDLPIEILTTGRWELSFSRATRRTPCRQPAADSERTPAFTMPTTWLGNWRRSYRAPLRRRCWTRITLSAIPLRGLDSSRPLRGRTTLHSVPASPPG
jgi:putative polyketide hydroxylase